MKTVVFQEIPDKISLCYSITGCGGRCKACHSPFLHNKEDGDELKLSDYEEDLKRYKSSAEVVLFLGGEWEEDFIDYLKLAKSYGFKTALYTSLNLFDVSSELIAELDYLKVGEYIEELGGLDKETTNQRLFDIKNGFKDITERFKNKRGV